MSELKKSLSLNFQTAHSYFLTIHESVGLRELIIFWPTTKATEAVS
jgi:hypothetical protein